MGRKAATKQHAEKPDAPTIGVMTPSGVTILDAHEYQVLKTLQKLLAGSQAAPASNDAKNGARGSSKLSADYATRWGGDLNTFGKFLLEHNINRQKFAQRFNITPAYVSMLTHGDRAPGLPLALDILEWTREEGLPEFGPEDWPRRK